MLTDCRFLTCVVCVVMDGHTKPTVHSTIKRTIIVGDIHGCFQEFLELLVATHWSPLTDRLILVGDLVGKGPEIRNVLKFCREMKIECVKGNFEDNWLQFIHDGKRLKSVGDAEVARSLSTEDWSYISSLPLYIELPEYNSVIVHAGLVPNVPLQQQDPWMMMNIRSINSDGKGNSEFESDDQLWARHWKGPYHVIFGHDAARGLQQEPFATGLDSGCVYGEKLTALILPERRFLHVAARRQYSQPVARGKL